MLLTAAVPQRKILELIIENSESVGGQGAESLAQKLSNPDYVPVINCDVSTERFDALVMETQPTVVVPGYPTQHYNVNDVLVLGDLTPDATHTMDNTMSLYIYREECVL